MQKLQAGFSAGVAARAAMVQQVESLAAEMASLETRMASLSLEQDQRALRLAVARERLKNMAVARYMATPVTPRNDLLKAQDFSEMGRRTVMVTMVLRSDQGRIHEHELAALAARSEEAEVLTGLDRPEARWRRSRPSSSAQTPTSRPRRPSSPASRRGSA